MNSIQKFHNSNPIYINKKHPNNIELKLSSKNIDYLNRVKKRDVFKHQAFSFVSEEDSTLFSLEDSSLSIAADEAAAVVELSFSLGSFFNSVSNSFAAWTSKNNEKNS